MFATRKLKILKKKFQKFLIIFLQRLKDFWIFVEN